MKQVLGVVFLAFITGLVVVGVNHYLIDPPLPVARAASQPTGGAAPAAPDEGDAVPGQRELVLKPGFASPLPATAAEINGQRVNFVFVPKAPMVILSLTDARRVGFQIEQLEFVDNGHMSRGEPVREAAVTLDEVRIGPLTVTGVDAIVTDDRSRFSSIIGRNFLDRLDGYEMRGEEIVLRY